MESLTMDDLATIGVPVACWSDLTRDSQALEEGAWRFRWCAATSETEARRIYHAARLTWLLVQSTN